MPSFRDLPRVALSWAPRLKVGRYELIAPIARGGMAEVWLAKQSGPEQFEKLVALKRILASAQNVAEFVGMFIDEARIAAQLSHPNIAQTFELADDGGTWYLAMEYLPGETLSRVLSQGVERGQPLPMGLAVRILADAAGGLGHAHHQRSRSGRPLDIVHRDVSPQNIMVTYDGVVKVVDFGIARAARRMTRTVIGVVKGKAQYMAPEQARGDEIDARADVFALGVVLYEALTGDALFPDDDTTTMQRLIDGAELPSVSDQRRDVPLALDALVRKAMAIDPALRFPSGLELQAALEDCLALVPAPRSSFEVRRYMEGLFADRIAQRRAMAVSSTGISANLAADAPAMATPGVVPSGELQTKVARSKPRASSTHPAQKGSRVPVIIAGLAAAVGLGLAAYAALHEAEPATAPLAPIVQPAPVQPLPSEVVLPAPLPAPEPVVAPPPVKAKKPKPH